MRIQLLSWLLLIYLFQIYYVSNQCLDDQRLLLVQLNNSLVYDSELSMKLAKWNTSVDCCSWDGVVCDHYGQVISLNLESESISDGIDDSSGLFGLRYLERLNLAFNDFNGTQIPKGLQNLTNLMYLNLSDAGFGGQVPVEVSTMRSLAILDLSISSSQFELKLENPNLQRLVQNLTGLTELYLDDVDVSAQRSDWCRVLSTSVPNLTALSLSNCGLSGPLDSSLSRLHSLSVLRLDENNLSTTVPDFFANFSNLKTLRLGGCNLHGPFPGNIFQISTLETLILWNNSLLSGTIQQFPLSNSFKTMALGFTNFGGSLPDSIGNLRLLSEINLLGCNFTGIIPTSIANLTELVYLNFVNNSFTGSIPSSLFGLPSLWALLLSDNKFSGQIIASHSSRLEALDLSGNQLEGPIPESFFKLEQLEFLSLRSNFFNGSVKLETIQRLSNLKTLHLGHNNLSVDTSNINSSSLPQFSQLIELDLASCNLHEFPDLRNQLTMEYLDLSSNYITGEIPNWIWNVGNGLLYRLNLSCNHLVDLQMPYKMSPSLGVLDLHSNRIRGQLPLDLGYFPNLIFFSLAKNSLTGTIPKSLCNSTSLKVLDLSSNKLSGTISPCLVGIPSLEVLNLRGNDINDNIPNTFPVDCGLETFDLSYNNLRGKIPLSLANCKSLRVMNVGNNMIHDTFPCMLKYSSSLRVLVLRNNKFHGDLRCSGVNESWSNLQIIDLASNNFSGELYPTYTAYWRGMMLDTDTQHQYFGFLSNTNQNSYYQDSVTITIKGFEMELVKILTIFTAINFSSNNFTGEIPETIGDLVSLYALNLSHNSFTGVIPRSIGNLKQLGSLDISMNQLAGEIPQELARLTFLSVLNLSYNNLVGMIPTGPQLQTFSAASFAGNPRLCGFNLNLSCSADGPAGQSVPIMKTIEVDWQLIMFISLGYGFGVSLVLYPLAFFEHWRERCNEQFDRFLKMVFPRY